MKIGYFGGRKWAHEAFICLTEDVRFEIVFVVLLFSNPDPVLREMAEQRGIPVFVHKNVNSKDFLEMVAEYKADIFVSMFFDQIFKAETYNFPKYKLINCHPGKLPYYRGLCALNWALINDEKEFGVTVHYVDDGIDTGDIIVQKVFPITDEDDYGTLLEVAYKGCTDALCEALVQIYDGTAIRISQREIDPVGLYGGARGPGDEIIDWNQSSREIFNFVRAMAVPGPMATSWVDGEKVCINKVRMISGARSYKGIPGQIIGKTEEGFIVKTRDTIVEIVEYESKRKLKVSDRLKQGV